MELHDRLLCVTGKNSFTLGTRSLQGARSTTVVICFSVRNLIRTGSGEDIEAVAELDHDEEEDLGRGRRMSKKPKRYGGDEIWEAA